MMIRAGLLICVALVLASCTDRRPAPVRGEAYIIERDVGGQLISDEADCSMLKRWGGPVEIRDYCASAFVIFTTLPNVCIAPDAKIGFHSSDVNVGFVGNPQMAKYLRGRIKQQFLAEWQFVPNTDIHLVSARDYVALDPQT